MMDMAHDVAPHKHAWVEVEWLRVCEGCLRVQCHNGKRWRDAPKPIRNYVHALVMMFAVHYIVTHPGIAERLREYNANLQKLLADVTAP